MEEQEMMMEDPVLKFPVRIKKLTENAKIPTKGSDGSAGYDLYAAIDEPLQIQPHTTEKISSGIAIACLPIMWMGIFARSGIATKRGLRPANCVGVVDSDYRGPVIVALHNDTDEVQTIEPGERIGQMIMMARYDIIFEETDDLDNTDRGASGFGDSGQF